MQFFPEFDAADLIGAPGYATAEDAACGDLPPSLEKVVRVQRSDDGERAIVLIELNEPPALAWETNYVVSLGVKWYGVCGGGVLGPARLLAEEP